MFRSLRCCSPPSLTLAYFVKLFEGHFPPRHQLDWTFSLVIIPLPFKLTLGITSAAIMILGLFSAPYCSTFVEPGSATRSLREYYGFFSSSFLCFPFWLLSFFCLEDVVGVRTVTGLGIPAIGLSFALSVAAFIEVLRNGPFTLSLYRFFQSGSLTIDLTLFVDQLTVLLLLLVTGVSGVVHVYSSRYMIGESRYNRFFAVIALFTFSMILLVMSGNLLMLLISWEVMGICSYLLISHAAERPSACRAATKAFLVNAITDVGLSFGIILTFYTFGTLDIQTILIQAEGMQGQYHQYLRVDGLGSSYLSCDADSLLPLYRGYGKISTNTVPRVVTRGDGSSDSGLGAYSCGYYGECRSLFASTIESVDCPFSVRHDVHFLYWRRYRSICRDRFLDSIGHQKDFGLFHNQSNRVHGYGLWFGCVCSCGFPSSCPWLLQSILFSLYG